MILNDGFDFGFGDFYYVSLYIGVMVWYLFVVMGDNFFCFLVG